MQAWKFCTRLSGMFFGKRTITRIEGSILILCYVAYTAVLIYNL